MLDLLLIIAQADVTEAAEAVTEAAASGNNWVEIILTVLGVVVTLFLVPLLKNKAAEARDRAEANRLESATTHEELVGMLKIQLESYLLEAAATIVERDFIRIARGVASGQYKSAAAVKLELQALGDTLREEAIGHFSHRGIDVVAVLGDKALDRMIRAAADRVSPFPGKETAVALAEDHLSNMLIKYGTHAVRNYVLSRQPEDEPAPVADTSPAESE